MAFKLGNAIVLKDSDASALVGKHSDLDTLQINGTDVLTHSGGVVTLKNVVFDDTSTDDTDAIVEGSANRFYTAARQTAIEAYADAAETDAETAAAATAESKDVARMVTSDAYADTAEAAAISTAADTAESKDVARMITSDAYADTAEADAISTAAATAESKDAARATAANAYADSVGSGIANHSSTSTLTEGTNLYYTDVRADARAQIKIDALVGGASAAYDTLVEIQNAMATDAELTSAISGLNHDTLTGFVANEHIDWTVDAGTNIHASNYTNTGDTTYTAGAGLTLTGTVFSNPDPDQTVSLTGAGATTISGTYPNFTITSTDNNSNTTYSAGTNVSISGSNVISSTDTNTNTTYTAGNGMSLSGTEFLMSGSYTGNFTASGDITAYSDKRLKSNIETIDNPLKIVNALRGVNFEKDGRHSTGVIAQEVEEVLPQVVHTDTGGMKSVAYGNITGLLIEAIKEQQELIISLQEQINNISLNK